MHYARRSSSPARVYLVFPHFKRRRIHVGIDSSTQLRGYKHGSLDRVENAAPDDNIRSPTRENEEE